MKPSTKRVVGLTGGIGVGKSTFAAMLERLGAVVVDCDQLGRDVVAAGGQALPGITRHFGPSVIDADGLLDRPALAGIVFNDPDQLAALNAITHPAIDQRISACIAAAPDDALVVLDMAVLVESALGAGQYETVVVVEAPLSARLERLCERGLTEEDAKARIASQASDAERRSVADHLVANDAGIGELAVQARRIWSEL